MVNIVLQIGDKFKGHESLNIMPAIGKQLGWHYSQDGLFRSVDANCYTMVESACWKDGPTAWYKSYSREESGEVWIVMASQEAIDQISSYHFLLKRQVMVERESYDGDLQKLRRYALRDFVV